MLTTKLFYPRGFALQSVLFRVSVSVSVSHRSKLTRDVTLTVGYSRQHVTSIYFHIVNVHTCKRDHILQSNSFH